LNVNIPSGFEKNLRADLLADWWRFMPRTGHSLARPAALRLRLKENSRGTWR
jgi:hypothetical protein